MPTFSVLLAIFPPFATLQLSGEFLGKQFNISWVIESCLKYFSINTVHKRKQDFTGGLHLYCFAPWPSQKLCLAHTILFQVSSFILIMYIIASSPWVQGNLSYRRSQFCIGKHTKGNDLFILALGFEFADDIFRPGGQTAPSFKCLKICVLSFYIHVQISKPQN